MKYRVVELVNGDYQCQYRMLFFWWVDSCHAASRDLEEQKAFARPDPRRIPILRIVQP